MSDPSRSPRLRRRLTLAHMQRLKNWHAAQQGGRPVEKAAWDAVLMMWLMGWIGWLPAFVFEVPWACPLCLLGMFAPRLYVDWRLRSHETHRLRCDWLDTVNGP